MDRREFVGSSAAGLALLGTAGTAAAQSSEAECGQPLRANAKAGRLKQSVARWCFAKVPIESFCRQLRDMGVTGMDLVGPKEWPTCKRYGILPCMVAGAGSFLPVQPGSHRRFGKAFGWNKVENHDKLVATARKNIELASENGLPNIIGLYGQRDGMTDEEGIDNCVKGLKRIAPLLEKKRVTLALEVLNSKVDHPGYQGDHTAYGVEVSKRVGSERVKVLYDAYHMQIMEGDLIDTIRANKEYIAHFHVAGVPGRHEIDATQEVNWHAVANAIADMGFDGYIAHEWTPTAKDPMAALRKAIPVLTV